MGVDNLLSFVKNAMETTNISRAGLTNSSAAVDISHWIFKASYSCPEVLYHRVSMHQAYETIINYIDNYVRLLLAHHVQITFVFDGMRLPAKKVTHEERSAKKEEARKLVEQHLNMGNAAEARKHMVRCMDIKFDIVEKIIEYCKVKGIKYIVAPYEADAQIAFLTNNGMCEYVITEDTDLILYGCNKIIYKMDQNGNCMLYRKTKLPKCLGPKGDEVSFEKFRRICILSGCDYLKNIPGVGLQSAKKFFLLTRQDNIELLLPKLPTYLKSTKLVGKVTKEYIKGFVEAETTFRHHIVYDPSREQLTPLEPYPKGKSSSDFPMAGKRFHRVVAKDLTAGKFNLDKMSPSDLDSPSDDSDIENDDEDIADSNGVAAHRKIISETLHRNEQARVLA